MSIKSDDDDELSFSGLKLLKTIIAIVKQSREQLQVDLNFALLYDAIDFIGSQLADADGSAGILPTAHRATGKDKKASALER